jgi:hypothetical protein|eukprot:COSAG01_NODE_498_length_16259_cov_11.917512_17_plen_55_part_00
MKLRTGLAQHAPCGLRPEPEGGRPSCAALILRPQCYVMGYIGVRGTGGRHSGRT